MTASRHLLSGLLCGLLLTSCGAIYNHVTAPLDTNMSGHELDVSSDTGRQFRHGTKHVVINSLRVDWGEQGIGQTAKRHGFKQVRYADVEVLSILGIWSQTWLHLYGE